MGVKLEQYSPHIKAQIVIAAMSREKTLAESWAGHGAPPTIISAWKQVLARTAQLLRRSSLRFFYPPQAPNACFNGMLSGTSHTIILALARARPAEIGSIVVPARSSVTHPRTSCVLMVDVKV
ncbi:MAG: hypothetical protein ACUVS3_07500, partial [Thermodesulfobacteriota bacterium]